MPGSGTGISSPDKFLVDCNRAPLLSGLLKALAYQPPPWIPWLHLLSLKVETRWQQTPTVMWMKTYLIILIYYMRPPLPIQGAFQTSFRHQEVWGPSPDTLVKYTNKLNGSVYCQFSSAAPNVWKRITCVSKTNHSKLHRVHKSHAWLQTELNTQAGLRNSASKLQNKIYQRELVTLAGSAIVHDWGLCRNYVASGYENLNFQSAIPGYPLFIT